MKKLQWAHRSLLMAWPKNMLAVIPWLEQLGAWFLATGVDWSKLPWAFGGASIAMLKARKDAQGNPIHKSFWEWLIYVVAGTFIAMAGWKDVQNAQHIINLSAELSTVVAGLIAWLLVDFIIGQAKKKLSGDETPKS